MWAVRQGDNLDPSALQIMAYVFMIPAGFVLNYLRVPDAVALWLPRKLNCCYDHHHMSSTYLTPRQQLHRTDNKAS